MKSIVIAALTLIIVSAAFGLWIACKGKPYNTLLLTIHKLSSIAYGVLCILYFIKSMPDAGLAGLAGFDVFLAAAYSLSLIMLLATGAVMSAKQPTALLRIAHIAATVVVYFGGGYRLVQFLIR